MNQIIQQLKSKSLKQKVSYLYRSQAATINSRLSRLIKYPIRYFRYQISRFYFLPINSATFWDETFHCYYPDYFYFDLAGLFPAPSEYNIALEMAKRLTPDSCFIDLGASCGFYTLLASRLTENRGQIAAFEPDPKVFNLLSENLGSNSNIHLEQKAIANHSGSASFRLERTHKFNNKIQDAGDSTIEINAITLDHYVKQKGISPDFIKIDIEGGELDALKGGAKTIQQHKPIITMEVRLAHQGIHNQAIKLLRQWGYTAHQPNDYEGFKRLDKQDQEVKDLVSDQQGHLNLLFMHPAQHQLAS